MTVRHYAMVLLPIRHLMVTLPLLLAAACTDGAPVRPAAPVVDAVDFQLAGVVTDDDGTPMAGAVVDIGFIAIDRSWKYVHAVTNQSGVYAVDFTALRGVRGSVLGGPALTYDTAALAWAYAPGCAGPLDEAQPGCAHDPDTRYIASNSPLATQNFRLRRMTRIEAGQPATITIAPGDRICGLEVLESICRSVRVVAPSTGTMKVEAIPVDATSIPARLYLLSVGSGGQATGSPASIGVQAGTEVIASVGIPWNSTASATFVLEISIVPR